MKSLSLLAGSTVGIILFQEGYAKHTGEWSRVFFMAFYIVMMVGLIFTCLDFFQNLTFFQKILNATLAECQMYCRS